MNRRLGWYVAPVVLALGIGGGWKAVDAAPVRLERLDVKDTGLLMSLSALAQAPQAQLWSDPQTWPEGRVPAEGDAVTVPAGQEVVLDVSPPRLASLTVEGTLRFADLDLDLRTDWIMVHGGRLQVGREDRPFTHRATLTLTDATPGEDVMNMGDKLIGVMGGQLDLHGEARLPWTRLARTITPGETRITLQEAPDWRPGDRVVIASTDFDSGQQETATVKSVSGKDVSFTEPLRFSHFGEVQTYAGRTVDERAEVGLLTRNITVQGELREEAPGFGGQVVVMDGGQARLENVELTRMGQRGQVRRYPLHFHLLGSAPTSYVRASSLHDLFNRCLTLHGTDHLTVAHNVMAGTTGHCLFLEDGSETGNVITGNLVLGTRSPEAGRGEVPVLPSDSGFPGAASYWISNPANTLRGNVAAGGDGVGFWYALGERPTGPDRGEALWPRRTPLGTFEDNTAHSYVTAGLNVDHGPQPDGTVRPTFYSPLNRPGDEKSAPIPAVFGHFTAYKNRGYGVWLRGAHLLLRDPILADNAVGATLASQESALEGGLIVGETANGGTPPSWEKAGAQGRSLPRPNEPDFPIRGFEFYDGDVTVRHTTFARFVPSPLRPASALGFRRHNRFPVSPANAAQDLHFVDANRVYLEDPLPGHDGDQSAVFLDPGGSVTGRPGSSVVAASPQLFDRGCKRVREWNAYVCGQPYGQLRLDDVGREGAGSVTLRRADGASVTLTGAAPGSPSVSTTVPVHTSYTVTLGGGWPGHLRLDLNTRRPGDWVRLNLPAPFEPALYRDGWIDERNRLQKVPPAQLDRTSGDSYAYENGVLSLKLSVQTGRSGATLDLCRNRLCE